MERQPPGDGQSDLQTPFAEYAIGWLQTLPRYFTKPAQIVSEYNPTKFRSDVVASLTVAIVLLPQAIAYALIAELPPQTGLFAAMVAAIIGGLWGSSFHLHTGPTNTTSLIVLSGLIAVATPGTPEYLLAAGVMAVWAGVLRLLMGVARLGLLVNFVSDSVVVGFTAGAGMLIVVNQLKHILGVTTPSSPLFFTTIFNTFGQISETHIQSLEIGVLVIVILLLVRRYAPSAPGALIAMVTSAIIVWVWGLDQQGVIVLGELPRSLPPIKALPLFDGQLLAEMAPSIVAVGLIGLIEAASISRAVASRSGQYLDSDQEFIGQGLANIATGFLSGYPVAGSLTRSAVNYEAGARTQLAAIYSAIWVLLAMLIFAPAAAFLPRAALAGILVVTGTRMINHVEMQRIWRTSKGDAGVMILTLVATLLLPLEFAVLTGVLVSFARYIAQTSTPTVLPLLPDDDFLHFEFQPDKPECPQLGVLSIKGSLYFGAAPYVEDVIRAHMSEHEDQPFLLLRMRRVNHCDISGIHMLETVVRLYRQNGGDVYIVGANEQVLSKMELSGFDLYLGRDHFLSNDDAIAHIFHNALDPSLCVYSCPFRTFKECQSLPKSAATVVLPSGMRVPVTAEVPSLTPRNFWSWLNSGEDPEAYRIIDIREPSEYEQGHLRKAEHIPMYQLIKEAEEEKLEASNDILFVCRSGRRSQQLTYYYRSLGYDNVYHLDGGMTALELAALPRSGGR